MKKLLFMSLLALAVTAFAQGQDTIPVDMKKMPHKSFVLNNIQAYKGKYSATAVISMIAYYDEKKENFTDFKIWIWYRYNPGPGTSVYECIDYRGFKRTFPVNGKTNFKFLSIDKKDHKPINYEINMLDKEGKRMAVEFDLSFDGSKVDSNKDYNFSFKNYALKAKMKIKPVDKEK